MRARQPLGASAKVLRILLRAWLAIAVATPVLGEPAGKPAAGMMAEVTIGQARFPLLALGSKLAAHPDLGIVASRPVAGQLVYESPSRLFETRAVITPHGDYLLMFPVGKHYGGAKAKVNDLVAIRSSDKGRTWTAPQPAFAIDYNQHGFIPLIPRGTARIYAFGTQPVWNKFSLLAGQHENAPIGFRWSDDDGHTWSDVRLIEPVNDPEFRGMSVMRMCETGRGTWLVGAHLGDWSKKPLTTCQYLLRSTDRGKTWTLLPDKRPGGWFVPGYNRMDEGRPISLGGDQVLMMYRTPEGHLWAAWSDDDGKSWTPPRPTPLVHPDAPPMLFHLSDGKTLAAFHHNRASARRHEGLSGNATTMLDRAEIWLSLSRDGGYTWTPPRFVFANALAPTEPNAWYNSQCSYLDAFVDRGVWHLFVPHRWKRVLHLTIEESELVRLPTAEELEN